MTDKINLSEDEQQHFIFKARLLYRDYQGIDKTFLHIEDMQDNHSLESQNQTMEKIRDLDYKTLIDAQNYPGYYWMLQALSHSKVIQKNNKADDNCYEAFKYIRAIALENGNSELSRAANRNYGLWRKENKLGTLETTLFYDQIINAENTSDDQAAEALKDQLQPPSRKLSLGFPENCQERVNAANKLAMLGYEINGHQVTKSEKSLGSKSEISSLDPESTGNKNTCAPI